MAPQVLHPSDGWWTNAAYCGNLLPILAQGLPTFLPLVRTTTENRSCWIFTVRRTLDAPPPPHLPQNLNRQGCHRFSTGPRPLSYPRTNPIRFLTVLSATTDSGAGFGRRDAEEFTGQRHKCLYKKFYHDLPIAALALDGSGLPCFRYVLSGVLWAMERLSGS